MKYPVPQYEVFSFLDRTVFLNILFSKFLNHCSSLNLINLGDKIIKSEYQQAWRTFNLPLILSWLQFGFLMLFAILAFYYHFQECVTHALVNTTPLKIMDSDTYPVLVTSDLLAGCDTLTNK